MIAMDFPLCYVIKATPWTETLSSNLLLVFLVVWFCTDALWADNDATAMTLLHMSLGLEPTMSFSNLEFLGE